MGTYVVFNGLLQLIIYTKEKNAILFTYPPVVSSLFSRWKIRTMIVDNVFVFRF